MNHFKIGFLSNYFFLFLYCQRTHVVDFSQTLSFKALPSWYSSAVLCTVWLVPFLQVSSCVLVIGSFGTAHKTCFAHLWTSLLMALSPLWHLSQGAPGFWSCLLCVISSLVFGGSRESLGHTVPSASEKERTREEVSLPERCLKAHVPCSVTQTGCGFSQEPIHRLMGKEV